MFQIFNRKPTLTLGEEARLFIEDTFLWLATQFSWSPC